MIKLNGEHHRKSGKTKVENYFYLFFEKYAIEQAKEEKKRGMGPGAT